VRRCQNGSFSASSGVSAGTGPRPGRSVAVRDPLRFPGPGQARSDSDIDVLVVVRDDSDYGDLIRRTSTVVSALSLQYDVVISRAFVSRERFEQEQSPFLLNVRREGVPV